jgi:hypothetical protein
MSWFDWILFIVALALLVPISGQTLAAWYRVIKEIVWEL